MLFAAKGILYKKAQKAYSDQLTRLLAESFADEPMTLLLKISLKDRINIFNQFVPHFLSEGHTIVAASEENPDEIIGTCVCTDYKSEYPPYLNASNCFAPIFSILEEIQRKYEEKRPNLKLGEALRSQYTAVSPLEKYRHRGIASNLNRLALEHAVNSGFKLMVADATGEYSRKSFEKSGFSVRAELLYKDFIFENERPFKDIAPPHNKIVFVEKVISHS
mmetsp:Transcript_70309/g.81949  ORF Transcript_70309/g.81949 Transcript_70309/m.81949 type:complete len:220 (+) Transcript_70309:31-690(+)